MAEPFFCEPGKGERLAFMGQISLVRASGAETGRLYSLVETRTPKGNGPPPHVHAREDEALFVLAGEYEVTVGETTQTAKPGTFVFAPRGIPHSYVATEEPARHLTIVTPPGFERFLADAAEATIAGPTAIAAVAERYGLTMLGEPAGGGS